jgi:hypothetical protein
VEYTEAATASRTAVDKMSISMLSSSVYVAPAKEAVLAGDRDLGIQRAVLTIPELTRDETMGVLDNYSRLLAIESLQTPGAFQKLLKEPRVAMLATVDAESKPPLHAAD